MYKTKSKRSLNSKNNLSCTVMTTAKSKLNMIIVLSCFRFVRKRERERAFVTEMVDLFMAVFFVPDWKEGRKCFI